MEALHPQLASLQLPRTAHPPPPNLLSLPVVCALSTPVACAGSLGWPAYVRWGVWFAAGTAVYLCYGLHHSQHEGRPPPAIGISSRRADDEGFDAALARGAGGLFSISGGGDDSDDEGTEMSRLKSKQLQA